MSGAGVPAASAATDRVQVVAGNHPVTVQVFAGSAEDHPVDLRFEDLTAPSAVAEATAGAQAVVVDDEELSRDHIEAFASSVCVIGKLGTGLDSVDVAAARENGVEVVYLPGSAVNEVADHTVAFILGAARGLLQGDTIAREDWDGWRRVGRLLVMSDSTVGMIGLGRIGHAVVRRLQPFGCRILVVDPALADPPEGTTLLSDVDELLSGSDIVNLQVPLIPSTHGLIGRRDLALMKPDALIVNTTRGGVIDQTALADALVGGRLGGAALDVLVDEPPALDDAILHAPRTLLTPHVAWYSASAEKRMRDNTLRAVSDFLRGEPLTVGALAP